MICQKIPCKKDPGFPGSTFLGKSWFLQKCQKLEKKLEMEELEDFAGRKRQVENFTSRGNFLHLYQKKKAMIYIIARFWKNQYQSKNTKLTKYVSPTRPKALSINLFIFPIPPIPPSHLPDPGILPFQH